MSSPVARRTRFFDLAALAAIVALGSTASAPPSNALAGRDFADPFVLRDGGRYYAFATGAGGTHVQAASSDDLGTWSLLPDALPALPAWASPSSDFTWAPSVLRRGDRFVMFYTTRHAASDHQCISRAVATSAAGPYVDASTRPLVCQVAGEASFCGSIDPSPFVDDDGSAYLLWKSDENDARCRGTSRLWGQKLTPDALDVTGPAVALLTMDQPWEHPLIEGPSMVAGGGALHLFYSANWYDSARYAVGHATCASPLGPCKKSTVGGPLLQSSATSLGPGGQEVFDDGRGGRYMAYHAWSAPNAGYAARGARSLRIARLTFASGMPVVTPLSP